jgi:hypothetical protein
MKRILAALPALAALACTAAPARAQRTPLSIEPRVGFAAPVGITREDQHTGVAVDGDLIVALNSLVSVYGGYGWMRATVRGADSVHVSWRGWDAGIRLTFTPIGPYTPFVRGGLVYQRARAETGAGVLGETRMKTGFHAGAGVELPLGFTGGRASVSPQVTFVDIQGVQTVNGQIGLHLRL